MSTQKDSELGDSIEDLKNLERGIQLAAGYIEREGRYEDVVISMGSTRSGKSTLINYLIGNKLIGERITNVRPPIVKKADNSPGPRIGIGPTSETIFPTRWFAREPVRLAIWDLPGFDDNRGVAQDIINAFYINELFKKIKSAKIILIIDINDILHDNIRPFLNLLESVEKLLNEGMRQYFDSIAVIFSKVPTEILDEQVDRSYISELLEYQTLASSEIDISIPAKDLVRHIIKNHPKIGLFKEVDVGTVTDAAVNDGIFPAILTASCMRDTFLKQVSPSISETSRYFLYEIRERLCSTEKFYELQNIMKDIYKSNSQRFESINTEVASRHELVSLTQELTTVKDKLTLATDTAISFETKISQLRTVDSLIKEFVDKHNLIQRAKFMEFIDRLLGLRKSEDFELNLQIIMTTAKTNTEILLNCIRLKNQEIDKTEADAESAKLIQKYKEENEQLKTEREAVEKHNEAMEWKMFEDMEKMKIAETQRYLEYQNYMQAYKLEEKYKRERRQREKYERRRTEEENRYKLEREQKKEEENAHKKKEKKKAERKKKEKRKAEEENTFCHIL